MDINNIEMIDKTWRKLKLYSNTFEGFSAILKLTVDVFNHFIYTGV